MSCGKAFSPLLSEIGSPGIMKKRVNRNPRGNIWRKELPPEGLQEKKAQQQSQD